ncbi:CDP-diacylglycerol--glycerol-3-phosphate 3-phosphatidyltransferase [Longimycelium tulufanense]|uniref:Phosphatidylinositol phosphate synthase n=1 Tax=Longimycelium tulufanense TaxID=907463 RepID=A0A8J3CC23_9PSEU|nr:CDP-alcohol phosphatidyltransferase family protein [Longimycelium tulufanense]GGM72163.1 CDP-diacylglycerol--glycerol-3-phosphate 3-phosphatidyltransferase [Longimycelium tulufanense]
MLNIRARASVSRVTDPIGAWLVRRGLTPNVVTVVGTTGTVIGALWFLPRGQLFVGALVVTVFVLFDLLDGAMARAAGSTRFGAVLDASCDRIADGALFGALAWYAFTIGDHPLAAAALVCLVTAQVISYIKARAEASGLTADGGLVERAERFIIALVGTGLAGLGLSWTLPVALYLLAVLSVVTVVQRLVIVHRVAKEADE